MPAIRCKDVQKSFNRRSAELKASAIGYSMRIKDEWEVDGLQCFMAETDQTTLKQGLGVFSECGACVNNNPRTWTAAHGKIDETVFLPKKPV